MVNYMNDIALKFEELIKSIKDSELYKRYNSIKEKMIDDKEINDLINKVKKLQRESVKESSKGIDVSSYDKEIEELLEKLNNIPLYVEYDYAMKDLNNELKIIKNTIESCINDITN